MAHRNNAKDTSAQPASGRGKSTVAPVLGESAGGRPPTVRIPASLGVITVPGLHGSGPTHWQSRWEARFPAWQRIEQRDWSRPSLHLWAERVADGVLAARRPTSAGTVVVAHSFGCLATLRQAILDPEGIAGALLVAPADPDKFGVGALLPTYRLPFPSIVVASRNDPWMTQRTAFSWGTLWGSELHDAGALGHINADSELGEWPDGLGLLGSLVQRIERPDAPRGNAERAPSWEAGVEVQSNFPYI